MPREAADGVLTVGGHLHAGGTGRTAPSTLTALSLKVGQREIIYLLIMTQPRSTNGTERKE